MTSSASPRQREDCLELCQSDGRTAIGYLDNDTGPPTASVTLSPVRPTMVPRQSQGASTRLPLPVDKRSNSTGLTQHGPQWRRFAGLDDAEFLEPVGGVEPPVTGVGCFEVRTQAVPVAAFGRVAQQC